MGERVKEKLVHGFGINDADYPVSTYEMVDGKTRQKICPFYSRWKDILRRTKSTSYFKYRPNYEEVGMQESWKRFSNFKKWMENQKWEGLYLDKDILSSEEKLYSESTCAFVPIYINNLILDGGKESNLPIGVTSDKRYPNAKLPYRAQLNKAGKKILGGFYKTAEEAHRAWQILKANYIEETIARYSLEGCFRTDVAEVLTKMVWDLRVDAAKGVETKSL